MGGDSRCAGTLEVKRGDWRPVIYSVWTLKTAAAACKELDCGSAVSVEQRKESSWRSVWRISSDCDQSGSALRECAISDISFYILNLTCSGKSISDIIYDIISDIIYDSNVSSMFLPPSQWHSVVSIELNCKVIQDNDILKCREVYDELF